jgi:hypothetical protein
MAALSGLSHVRPSGLGLSRPSSGPAEHRAPPGRPRGRPPNNSRPPGRHVFRQDGPSDGSKGEGLKSLHVQGQQPQPYMGGIPSPSPMRRATSLSFDRGTRLAALAQGDFA